MKVYTEKTMRITTLILTALLTGVANAGNGNSNEVSEGRKGRGIASHERRRMEEARRSLLLEEHEIENNLSSLKQQYFEFHGTELTNDMIDEALEKAHAGAGGEAFGPDRKILMYGSVPEFEGFDVPDNVVYMNDIESDHPDYRHRHLLTHRRTQTVRKQNMFIVAGNSPGWLQNRGRNEFFCVSLYSLDRQNHLPQMGEPVTLRNCYTTPGKAIALRYAEDFTVRTQNDNIYYTWCIRVKKAKRNQEALIDTCNFFDNNEVWNLFISDNTWRPGENADLNLCITSEDNPSDGGHLFLDTCDTQYNFGDGSRRVLALPEGEQQASNEALALVDEDGEGQEFDPVERILGQRKRRRRERRNDRRNDRLNKRYNRKNKNNKNTGKRWYQGSLANRMRQVWIPCIETDTCLLNLDGFLDCNLVTACQPGDPLP